MTQVLIIEDDAPIRRTMAKALHFEGYTTLEAEDGREGLELISSHRPDLVVTDLAMPEIDGDAVVTIMRSHRATRLTPIIVITARDDRSTQRRLFEMGVDDFLTKPITIEELIGTVSTQLRRKIWQSEDRREGQHGCIYVFGDWHYNTALRNLSHTSGQDQTLPPTEAHVLTALLENPGELMKRQALFKRIGRSASSPYDRHIDVLVGKLRNRIEADTAHPKILKTVWGEGYVFDSEVKILLEGRLET